jgi:putative holliday junction resolvase
VTGADARPPGESTVLAFDYGMRRIGVAIGNTIVGSARELATIDQPAADARFAAIATLVDAWRPDRLVVGLPLHADGTAHAMTSQARRFARRLEGRFGLPVALVDERFTTQAARSALSEEGRGGRQHRALRDAVAARIILQAYFDDPTSAAS